MRPLPLAAAPRPDPAAGALLVPHLFDVGPYSWPMSRRPHESRTLSRSRTQVHPHPHASEIAPRAAADLYSLLCDAMVAADTKAIDALLTDYCVLTHMTGYPQPKVEWLGDIANGAMRYHSHEVVSVQPDTIAGFPVVRGRTRTTATLWGGRGTWNLQIVGYVVPDGNFCWSARTCAAPKASKPHVTSATALFKNDVFMIFTFLLKCPPLV